MQAVINPYMRFFYNLNGDGTIIKPSIQTMAVHMHVTTPPAFTPSHLGGWQLPNQRVNTALIFIRTGRMGGIRFAFLPTADTLGGFQLQFQESSQD